MIDISTSETVSTRYWGICHNTCTQLSTQTRRGGIRGTGCKDAAGVDDELQRSGHDEADHAEYQSHKHLPQRPCWHADPVQAGIDGIVEDRNQGKDQDGIGDAHLLGLDGERLAKQLDASTHHDCLVRPSTSLLVVEGPECTDGEEDDQDAHQITHIVEELGRVRSVRIVEPVCPWDVCIGASGSPCPVLVFEGQRACLQDLQHDIPLGGQLFVERGSAEEDQGGNQHEGSGEAECQGVATFLPEAMHVLPQDGSDEHAQDAAGVDGPVEGGEEACDVSRLGGMKLVPAEGTDARLDPSRPDPQEHQSAPHPPGAGGIARQSREGRPSEDATSDAVHQGQVQDGFEFAQPAV